MITLTMEQILQYQEFCSINSFKYKLCSLALLYLQAQEQNNATHIVRIQAELDDAKRFISAVGARLGCKENESVFDALDAALKGSR